MTDKEAYELMVKYSRDDGLVMIREMLHMVGIEETVNNMAKAYAEAGVNITDDFKAWMRQSFQYLNKQILKSLN